MTLFPSSPPQLQLAFRHVNINLTLFVTAKKLRLKSVWLESLQIEDFAHSSKVHLSCTCLEFNFDEFRHANVRRRLIPTRPDSADLQGNKESQREAESPKQGML